MSILNKNEGIIALPMTQKEVVSLVAKGTRKGIWQTAIRATLGGAVLAGIGYGVYKLVEDKVFKTPEQPVEEDFGDEQE